MNASILILCNSIPIASLPIDLLAVQFLLPPIIGYIVPREFSKKSVITWWHIVSHHLRLSSYMFGGRYPEEEGNFKSGKADVSLRKDGGLVRVPTHDNVPIVVPRRRMIVPVHPITLEPLNQVEKNLGHPATSQSGDEERDTTIVYIPPFFYVRLSVFLFLIWTTGSVLVCSISVAPCKLIKEDLEMAKWILIFIMKNSETRKKSVCKIKFGS